MPALVVGSVRHTRYRPRRHSFTYGHYQWLVDLDDPPQMPRGLGWLGTLRPEDHLGSPTSFPALRAEVLDAVAAAGLAAESVERVVMLAHARILGHVFDPMSAFWCLDADGRVVAVLVEVHNTYAGRHAYVVEPDPGWRAEVDKELFVSPFNDTSGRYLLHLELTPDRVVAVVRLVRDGSPVVTALITMAWVSAVEAPLVADVMSCWMKSICPADLPFPCIIAAMFGAGLPSSMTAS